MVWDDVIYSGKSLGKSTYLLVFLIIFMLTDRVIYTRLLTYYKPFVLLTRSSIRYLSFPTVR